MGVALNVAENVGTCTLKISGFLVLSKYMSKIYGGNQYFHCFHLISHSEESIALKTRFSRTAGGGDGRGVDWCMCTLPGRWTVLF